MFHGKSLRDIISEYEKSAGFTNDKDGKKLFNILDSELRERRVSRSELITMTIDYIFESSDVNIDKITSFLKKQLA